jgi:hypothetical protein
VKNGLEILKKETVVAELEAPLLCRHLPAVTEESSKISVMVTGLRCLDLSNKERANTEQLVSIGYLVKTTYSYTRIIVFYSPPPQISPRISLRAYSSASNMYSLRRMTSSWMLRYVTLVRSNISEELGAPLIWVTGIGELGTTLPATSEEFFAACVGC